MIRIKTFVAWALLEIGYHGQQFSRACTNKGYAIKLSLPAKRAKAKK